MEFFDEFEIIGGIIPNLIKLAILCVLIIYFDKPEKQKSDDVRKYLFINR